ncbi:MAG: sodium-dependent transporter [Treponema sp.]
MGKQKRELFKTNLGMLLACVGSAMGLANIWMFPARLGEFGGITFLIPYLIFLFGFSSFGLMGEYAFGRKMRKGPVAAFEAVLAGKTKIRLLRAAGWFPVTALIGILSFYTVIIGWILRYFILALFNDFEGMNSASFFNTFAGTPANIPWTVTALVITAVIVGLGIQKGIERFTTGMMATFYIVVSVIVLRAITLPGALDGVALMLMPKWEVFFHLRVWVYALGMAFFTLSLGGAAMLVYGSYMPEKTDIPLTARQTAGLDLLASIMCASFTIPAAFSLGLNPQAGPALLFITVPKIVTQMPAGYIFGILFFLCALFASLTSSIVMLEVPVEALMSKCKISRKAAAWIISIIAGCIAVPLNFDMQIFSLFTDAVAIIIFPLAAVTAAFIIFWVYGAEQTLHDINLHARNKIGSWYAPYMQYVFVPVCLILVIAGIFLGDL